MRVLLPFFALVLGFLSTFVSTSVHCKQYAIGDKDTCRTIAKAAKITYAQLLAWNPDLDITCRNLNDQTDGKVCISNPLGDFALPNNSQVAPTTITTEAPIPTPTGDGTNAHCGEWYLVALGDDCSAIATNHSITRKDLLFLNPQLFDNCTNLLADVHYCVQPVGDISTYPGYGGSTTRPPFNPMPVTSVPFHDRFKVDEKDPKVDIIPIANGTRRDCYDYMYLGNVTDSLIADCWNICQLYDQSAEDFILWNPSLAQNDDDEVMVSPVVSAANPYAYPCTISANTSYCVMLASPTPAPEEHFEPPSPLSVGTAENCTRYHRVESWNTCETIMDLYYLDMEQFFSMNPAVKKDCTGLALGTWYCISIWPDGEYPPDPAEEDDEDSDIPTTTTSETQSATDTMVSKPSPTQTGLSSNCTKFYKVQGGDGCWAIANDNSIDLDDFYKWNPAVKDDCSMLQAGYYVCLGVDINQTSVSTHATRTAS